MFVIYPFSFNTKIQYEAKAVFAKQYVVCLNNTQSHDFHETGNNNMEFI